MWVNNFEKALGANPKQNPQDVADAISALIDTPAGDRPFRTIVDKIGMGEAIEGYKYLGKINWIFANCSIRLTGKIIYK